MCFDDFFLTFITPMRVYMLSSKAVRITMINCGQFLTAVVSSHNDRPTGGGSHST